MKIFILVGNNEFNFVKKFCFSFLFILIYLWDRLRKISFRGFLFNLLFVICCRNLGSYWIWKFVNGFL